MAISKKQDAYPRGTLIGIWDEGNIDTRGVSGENPLPISGNVDAVVTVGATNLQYNNIPVTSEAPLPTDIQYNSTPVTRNDPLPTSGVVHGPNAGPLVFNVELDASGAEYSQALPGPLYSFDIRPSGAYALKAAFVTGQIALEQYITIDSGGSYGKENLRATGGLTVFVASDFDDGAADGAGPGPGDGREDSRGAQIIAWTE